MENLRPRWEEALRGGRKKVGLRRDRVRALCAAGPSENVSWQALARSELVTVLADLLATDYADVLLAYVRVVTSRLPPLERFVMDLSLGLRLDPDARWAETLELRTEIILEAFRSGSNRDFDPPLTKIPEKGASTVNYRRKVEKPAFELFAESCWMTVGTVT